MDRFQNIYETMLGFLEMENTAPGVEDAFVEGGLCLREYERMRQAYESVCHRLGIRNEDGDLDNMVNAMENIQKELCRRMYLYGMREAEGNAPDNQLL